MPDTGAPWNIPYVENADLVRDWPADSLLVANAVAAGLSAAGGLVEVKSAIFTGTQSAGGVASGGNVAVTDLSITHTVADAANRVILISTIGAASEAQNVAGVGLAVAVDGALVNIGDTAGDRVRVTSGGRIDAAGSNAISQVLSATTVYTPGSGAKTYALHIINIVATSNTLHVNRSPSDADNANNVRAASSLILIEVKV